MDIKSTACSTALYGFGDALLPLVSPY
jgi:hypothetical protein